MSHHHERTHHPGGAPVVKQEKPVPKQPEPTSEIKEKVKLGIKKQKKKEELSHASSHPIVPDVEGEQ